MAMFLSASLRVVLDIALLQLLCQVVGRTPCQCTDRECRVLIGVANERSSIGNKQVVDVVSLAIFVQGRCLWIAPHADGAQFVDDSATDRYAPRLPLGVS